MARDLAALEPNADPKQLTSLHAAQLLSAWKMRYTPQTIKTKRACLKKLLYAIGATVQLPRGRNPQARTTTAEPGETEKLLAGAKPHMRLLVLLCWQLALRSGEAAKLPVGGIHRHDRTITVLTKGRKQRLLPLTPDTYELLVQAQARSTHPEQTAIAALLGRPIAAKALREQFHRLKKQTGVNPRLNLHDLRRTTATELYTQTKDLRAVQDYLGHNSLASTLHYLAPFDQGKLQQLQRLLRFHSEVRQ